MWLRSVAHKCQPEVWFISVAQKLLRKVDQKKCGSEVLPRTVDQKKCGSEVLVRCRSKVSLRSVNQKLCSDVLLRSLVRAGISQLCSASLVREVQVSSSSWKIATL